jgi:hypothetical protein
MAKIRGLRHGLQGIAAALPLLATVGVVLASSSARTPEVQERANRYLGAESCKNCHSSANAGSQYEVWTRSKHSQAYATLATEKALEYAKERGIEDPQKSDECLKCHVTGFGSPKKSFKRGFDTTLGVQCESCHGPAEKHFKTRFAAAVSGDQPEYSQVDPDEIIVSPPAETCLQCHNEESPAYKPFCFHEFQEKIRHLNPLKPRTEEEKSALDDCACDAECACVKEKRCTGSDKPPAKGEDKGVKLRSDQR